MFKRFTAVISPNQVNCEHDQGHISNALSMTQDLIWAMCILFLPVEGAGIPHDIKQSDKAAEFCQLPCL